MKLGRVGELVAVSDTGQRRIVVVDPQKDVDWKCQEVDGSKEDEVL